jgi:hypothetical protein
MDNRDFEKDSTDSRVEREKDSTLRWHDSNPSHLDEAGEAFGGIGGVVAGAAIGSIGGPVGTVIGGIAGALGGWWSGRAVAEAASNVSKFDDEFYRGDYESSPNRLADRSYEDVRPAYHLGHVAAHNPDYAGKNWSEVSSDLQRSWSPDHARKFGEWSSLSSYAGNGFMRARAMLGAAPSKTKVETEQVDDKATIMADDMEMADDMKNRAASPSTPNPTPDVTQSPPPPESRR